MQIKRRFHRHIPTQEKRIRMNEMIRIPEIFLIDENGVSQGVTPTSRALQQAKDVDLDLVEVNPKAQPPVCKIMDYGKIKYEQEKQAHKQKMANKKLEIKGIRLSFKIKGNDLETRLNQTRKFLADGHQVKIEMILRGREKAHAANAKSSLHSFVNQLGEDIKVIQPVQQQGGKFLTILAPNK